MGGFVTSTRMFTNVPGAEYRTQVYFFNLVNQTGLPRPRRNASLPSGKVHQWFPHVRTPTDIWNPPSGPTNYTEGVFVSLRWSRIRLDNAKKTMRNLECDFSPHLILDVHARWPSNFLIGGAQDIYATNPWWDTYPIPTYPQYDSHCNDVRPPQPARHLVHDLCSTLAVWRSNAVRPLFALQWEHLFDGTMGILDVR